MSSSFCPSCSVFVSGKFCSQCGLAKRDVPQKLSREQALELAQTPRLPGKNIARASSPRKAQGSSAPAGVVQGPLTKSEAGWTEPELIRAAEESVRVASRLLHRGKDKEEQEEEQLEEYYYVEEETGGLDDDDDDPTEQLRRDVAIVSSHAASAVQVLSTLLLDVETMKRLKELVPQLNEGGDVEARVRILKENLKAPSSEDALQEKYSRLVGEKKHTTAHKALLLNVVKEMEQKVQELVKQVAQGKEDLAKAKASEDKLKMKLVSWRDRSDNLQAELERWKQRALAAESGGRKEEELEKMVDETMHLVESIIDKSARLRMLEEGSYHSDSSFAESSFVQTPQRKQNGRL